MVFLVFLIVVKYLYYVYDILILRRRRIGKFKENENIRIYNVIEIEIIVY